MAENSPSFRARRGDRVRIAFEATLEDGEAIDRSPEGGLILELGSPESIPGFWRGIVGMAVGETRDFVVAPDLAYGERDERRVQWLDRNQLPEGASPGDVIMARADHRDLPLVLQRIEGQEAVLDGNHPLAGHALHFHVELFAIEGGFPV